MSYTNWLKRYKEIFPHVLVYILPLVRLALTASIWVVVLLAVNRYIAVCLPFKSLRLCTISNVKKQLAFVLLSAVVYNIPTFAENRIKYMTYDNGTTYKPHVVGTTLATEKFYDIMHKNVSNVTFTVVLPLFTLTYVNIRLIKVLKAGRRIRMEMVNQRQQNDNNVTIVLIIVVVVFIICQVPAVVGKALLHVMSKDASLCGGYHFYLRPVANTLVVLNSAVNFVIYVLFNKRFRHVLSQTVDWCSVLRVEGQRPKSTGRLPRVMTVICVKVSQKNDNDMNVAETRV